MAMNGMESMMVALLGKMGIDPEVVKKVALDVTETTGRVNAGLLQIAEVLGRIEARLERLENVADRILGEVTPTPAGGYVLGDGSAEDVAFHAKLDDALRPFPENVALSVQEDMMVKSDA